MKRDMDLIRAILLMVEAGEIQGTSVAVEGCDPHMVAEHIELLLDAGLILGKVTHFLGDEPPAALVRRLTWSGHEFLAAARNETVWSRTKVFVKEKGGDIPFSVLQALLTKTSETYFLGGA